LFAIAIAIDVNYLSTFGTNSQGGSKLRIPKWMLEHSTNNIYEILIYNIYVKHSYYVDSLIDRAWNF